jgi:hypothetical protein
VISKHYLLLLGIIVFCLNRTTLAVDSYCGIKAGCNLSTWWNAQNNTTMLGNDAYTLSPYAHREIKPGLAIGAQFETILFSSVFFQPELMFSMKGYGKRELRNDPIDTTLTTVNLDYLELPLLLKWRFSGTGLKPSIYLGPVLSLLVYSSGIIDNTGKAFSDEDKDYLFKYTSTFDFGATVGGSIEKKIGKGFLLLDIRLTAGFLNINKLSSYQKEQGVSKKSLLKDKNAVFSIMAGYSVPLNIPSAGD